jgi:hypothetical protein
MYFCTYNNSGLLQPLSVAVLEMDKATTEKSKHDTETDSDGKEIGKPIPSHD